MSDLTIFTPYAAQNLVTGVASASVILGRGSVVRLWNNSSFAVFVRFGDAAVVATANDTGIPAGAVETFNVAPNPQAVGGIPATGQPYLAAISPGGAGILNYTTGEGA